MMNDDTLRPRGQSVYDALVNGRDVTAVHKILALNAARMADTLDRIEEELLLDPSLTTENGQGTVTVNPLITEQRMITGALSQILAKMGMAGLPDAKPEKSKFDELAERRAERLRSANGGSETADTL